MRKFKCDDCGYEFEVPRGTEGKGRDMKCPKCGGNIHRIDSGGKGKGAGKGEGKCSGGRGIRN